MHVPELIALSSLLAHIEMYGNHNEINSARDRVRPPANPIYNYGKFIFKF